MNKYLCQIFIDKCNLSVQYSHPKKVHYLRIIMYKKGQKYITKEIEIKIKKMMNEIKM